MYNFIIPLQNHDIRTALPCIIKSLTTAAMPRLLRQRTQAKMSCVNLINRTSGSRFPCCLAGTQPRHNRSSLGWTSQGIGRCDGAVTTAPHLKAQCYWRTPASFAWKTRENTSYTSKCMVRRNEGELGGLRSTRLKLSVFNQQAGKCAWWTKIAKIVW